MKAVNLIIAVLVAFAASGIAFFLANAQTGELETRVQSLQDELNDTKMELAKAKQELAKADTSKLRGEVSELSDALWGRVGDLTKKDAELESQIEGLAARPAPAAATPRLAEAPRDPDDPNADPDVQDVQKLLKGAGKMFEGLRGRMFDRQMERYSKELNLTESQSADVKKVLEEQTDKLMDNVGKMLEGGEGMDRRELMEQLTKDRDEALQQILTPEQFEKFKEMERNPRWLGGGRRGRQGDQPGGQR